jgi:flagellar biosynthetic protein FlhB
MSENASSEDKKHKPTSKRLTELRKQGTFLRSKEMSSGFILIISIIMIISAAPELMQGLNRNLVDAFSAIEGATLSPHEYVFLYRNIAISSFLMLLPLCLPMFVAVFAVVFAFGGLTWSFHVFIPKLSRFNPLTNLKKPFTAQNLFELLKSVLKLVLFFSILILFLFFELNPLLNLTGFKDPQMLGVAFHLVTVFLFMMAGGVFILVAIDMLYSYTTHQKKIMMTNQEVKDEQKDSEGSPESKRRIRSAQMAMTRQRLRRDVPRATVIITNPTHFAVALKYDDGIDATPLVLAKGKDMIAAEIRLLAIKNGIPIYQAPPLARALYYTAETGSTIHPSLYMGVAIVLSYVYQLKRYQSGQGDMPIYVSDLQIPEEMRFDNRV